MKKACCGMCIHFYCGKCSKKDYERVDCLDKCCDDFEGFFAGGDY